MMIRRNLFKTLASAAAALTLCGAALAQSYPTRPLTMIVPSTLYRSMGLTTPHTSSAFAPMSSTC